jgi:methylmalonyl-CoA mutase
MKNKYGANERAQMLKYHIQTSGRSLHAQEIDFNDIRTTLQALYAIYDNCNSLHTMPMMRQSQHQQRSQCVVQWRFS